MAEVLHADLELFLTGYIRDRLADRPEPICARTKVDNTEKAEYGGVPLVVVRYDGSTPTSIVTDEASVGFTILAGTLALPKDANDLARIVRAIVGGCARAEAGNPVAFVATTGPIAVPDAGPRARRYFTASMSVVGAPL